MQSGTQSKSWLMSKRVSCIYTVNCRIDRTSKGLTWGNCRICHEHWAFYTHSTSSISLTPLWPDCSFWSVNHVCFRALEPFLHSFFKWLKVRNREWSGFVIRVEMLLSGGRISCLGLHCYAADGQLSSAAGESAVASACVPPDYLTFDPWSAIRLVHFFNVKMH